MGSPLFVRHIPGGVFHVDNTALTLGNIWYVDSNASGKGTTAGYGSNPDMPWSTVAAALDSGLLASGDVVFVAAGHAESIIAAAGWDADTIGITIKGLGIGDQRPTITLSTDALADIDIDAANITFDNLRFVANKVDIAAAIDVNSDGFTIRNCEFVDTSVILNALIWILGAAAGGSDRMIVENCEFYAYGTNNTAAISLPGTPDRCIIRDNVLCGNWVTGAILAAGAITKASILRNLISQTPDSADKCIKIAATSTGIVAYNGVGTLLSGNATTNINVGSTMSVIQNYSVDIGDRQGVLDPVAT